MISREALPVLYSESYKTNGYKMQAEMRQVTLLKVEPKEQPGEVVYMEQQPFLGEFDY
jgi:hypothetical protein